MNQKKQRGFTLIELLVVIAIIGILSSVVLASLNQARSKSRDARRVADIKQVQTALELYYDANSSSYPTATTSLVPTYIAVMPTDPSTQAAYAYSGMNNSAGGNTCTTNAKDCTFYHLGTTLEGTANVGPLASDRDLELGLTGDVVDGLTTAAACGSGSATASTDKCYDVTP